MALKLPPVDVYRAPFIEPFGHLIMQAALADEALIKLCAEIPSTHYEEPVDYGAVAHELRNWNNKAKEFVGSQILMISDPYLRDRATEAVGRFDVLRDLRHRAVHDAVAIGVYGGNMSYYVQPHVHI